MSDKIAEVFDVVPLEEINTTEVSIVEDEETSVVSDLDSIQETEEIQNNVRDAIVQTKDVLDEIIVLAKTSEQPRAYEVAAGMIKTLLEANRDLLNASKHKHEIKHGKGAKSPSAGTTNISNSNVVLTTAEMLKRMRDKNDE